MKLKLSLLALGLLATPLQAATEMTGDIPVELAKTLIGMAPGQDVKIFSDLPDNFPLATLPAGIDVVAGIDQSYLLRVLVRADAGVASGEEILRLALLDAGWRAWEQPSQGMMGVAQNGFITAPRPAVPEMFCKGDAGMLQYSRVEMDQETLLMFSYNVLPPGAMGPCSQGQDGPFGRGMNPSVLQQHMPRLELPAAMTSRGAGLRPDGTMASRAYFESSASANTDLSLQQLFDHFVEQINAQGWQVDASTVGEGVANGFWRKTPEADLDLIGILTVIRSDEQSYALQFRVQRLGADANPAMGIRTIGP